ncbi:MAG TPA: helix-turn-helix domain-containing protein [Caulobacter sp.]|nr:helix-turn-helix domain-containing protein [Caulobacter sp.]
MSKPPRRRLPPEARRLEIVEAAERLINTHGSRVRVEDVVREAGVAKGTFFLYFPTWDDLLEAIRVRLVATFDAAHPLPTELEGQIDWPALMETQAAAFIDHTLSRRGLGEAVFHSDFAQRRPLADNAVLRLSAVIRAGQEAGAFGPVDPEPTARLLFAAIHDAADAVAEGEDRAVVLAALHNLLRRTLAPDV